MGRRRKKYKRDLKDRIKEFFCYIGFGLACGVGFAAISILTYYLLNK